MNVNDESLLSDNPEYKFLEPMLQKLRVRGEAPQHATCNSRSVLPSLLHQLRPPRDVTGVQKGASGQASVGHVVTRRLPASKHSLLKNFDGQRPVAMAQLMARQWKRTRFWSTLTCLAFGRQSHVHQALVQTALQRHVRGLLRFRRIGGFVPSTD